MEYQRDVQITYKDEKTIKWLCPNCDKEMKASKNEFFNTLKPAIVLCKECCKKKHIKALGGVVLPTPETRWAHDPVIRFYNSTIPR